jgi:biopolymer transport protein ExbD
MGLKLPKTDDSSLNMTPMIDIVFQLILFFLFNLRFKSLDYRIETALPKDRGLAATPQIVQDIPSIKVTLFRENADSADAFTKIKVAGGNPILMPPVKWTRDKKLDTEIENTLDARYEVVKAQIHALFKANADLKGEIECPPPKGPAVPHSDVIRVLDCFLQVGVKEVNFVGQAFPLPKAKGGSQG